MSALLGVLAMAVLLVVAVWVAVFGVTGAMLGHHRRGSATTGFVLGVLLGPIGWLLITIRRPVRRASPRPAPLRSGTGARARAGGQGDGIEQEEVTDELPIR